MACNVIILISLAIEAVDMAKLHQDITEYLGNIPPEIEQPIIFVEGILIYNYQLVSIEI